MTHEPLLWGREIVLVIHNRFAPGKDLTRMGAFQLAAPGIKRKHCSVTLPPHIPEHCYDSLVTLPAEHTKNCLHLSALKPVWRDGEVAVLCSCVSGYASRLCYTWMTLFQQQSCWRSTAPNIKKTPNKPKIQTKTQQQKAPNEKAWRRPPFCQRTSGNLDSAKRLWTGKAYRKKPRDVSK